MARSIVEQLGTRAAFDRMDAALRAIMAFTDPDVLAARIAFPGHNGTADMIKQAKKANVMVAIVSPEGAIQYV